MEIKSMMRSLAGPRRCNCETCRLSRCLTRIVKKCTQREKAALEVVWNRMECAETELEWIKSKSKRSWRHASPPVSMKNNQATRARTADSK